jgi:hypothetical protein
MEDIMIWVEIDRYEPKNGCVGGRLTTIALSGNSRIERERPHYGGGWFVRDDIHEWLMSMTEYYRLVWNEIKENSWHVGVEDPKVAMLFKLTWIGN